MNSNRRKMWVYESCTDWKRPIGPKYGIKEITWQTVSRFFCLGALVLATFSVAEGAKIDNGDMELALTGPDLSKTMQAEINVPFEGIRVKLINKGDKASKARLRVFVHKINDSHDAVGSSLATKDIKIEVLEGKSWNEIQTGPIDHGVMGAIGERGKAHKERSKRGGFAIGKKAKLAWSLRLTFRQPGSYTLVLAVSPDNGSTHYVQPLSMNLEVL